MAGQDNTVPAYRTDDLNAIPYRHTVPAYRTGALVQSGTVQAGPAPPVEFHVTIESPKSWRLSWHASPGALLYILTEQRAGVVLVTTETNYTGPLPLSSGNVFLALQSLYAGGISKPSFAPAVMLPPGWFAA